MKYYSYSGRKSQSRFKANRKKLIINISVIAATVVLSVAFALILGNHLKNKLESAELSTDPADDLISSFEPVKNDPADGIDFVKNDRAEGEMAAVYGYLDIEGCPNADTATKYLSSLKSNGYTGFIFNAKKSDGKYSYASKAASEMAKIALPSSVTSYDTLSAVLSASSSNGMRSAAYIYISNPGDAVSTALDGAVIKELSAMGFSEIIFGGFAEGVDLTYDLAKELYAYVSALRTECPSTDFGLVISPAVLEDPESTPPLEIVFRFIDFFALDLSDRASYGAEEISKLLDNYSGSFSAYSILALVDGSDISAIIDSYSVFAAKEHPNVAYLTPKTDYKRDEKNTYSAKIEQYSLTGEKKADGKTEK